VRRTNRGPEASQKASPNRSDELTPTIASCRSSTVLMKCACPITTLKSSGLSTGTTSQESVVVVTRTCCHLRATATVGRAPAANDENIVVILQHGDSRLSSLRRSCQAPDGADRFVIRATQRAWGWRAVQSELGHGIS